MMTLGSSVSETPNTRVVIYNCNMFVIQAIDSKFKSSNPATVYFEDRALAIFTDI
jgi:hypothetical protein